MWDLQVSLEVIFSRSGKSSNIDRTFLAYFSDLCGTGVESGINDVTKPNPSVRTAVRLDGYARDTWTL